MPFALGPHQAPALVLLGCGAFGALWGSFLNVVIVRLPRGESIVFPASHCVACGAVIRAYDNIPVLSYLILRGRCRRCGSRYSARYPLIELTAGLAASGCVEAFGLSVAALGYFVFLALLLAIAAIDLEHWIIPHELSWPGITAGLLFSPLNPGTRVLGAVGGAAIAFGAFTFVSWLGQKVLKREALGLGDRWLFAMEGAFLGVGALLPLVFLASVQGSIVGLALIGLGRAQTGHPAAIHEDGWVPPKNAIPFGPFLALAGAEWLFIGPALLAWYQQQIQRLVS
jgi:leader peptidase (prepilin peptidase) / N-methyltransferase